MATELKSTGFQDAVDYKVISCTGIDGTTAQTNPTNAPGTLYGVIIDSAQSSANVSLHILDTADTANTQMAFKDDTTSFAGSVNVTLLCS